MNNIDDPNYGYASLFNFDSQGFLKFVEKVTTADSPYLSDKIEDAADLIFRKHGHGIQDEALLRLSFQMVHDACVWNARMLTPTGELAIYEARNQFLKTLPRSAKRSGIDKIPTKLFGRQSRKDRVLGVT